MRTIPLLLVLGAGTGAFAGENAALVTHDEFKVAAGVAIEVDSAGGGVTLQTGPAGVVRVETVRKADSDGVAKQLEAGAKLSGNSVRVTYKQHGGHWSNGSVDFHIIAPADSKIDVHTGGGSIEAGGFGGGIKVDTSGGSIRVADAHGPLSLRSGGGSIEVHHVAGSVDISTGGGSIRVDGALSGKSRVETGGGSIHVSIPGDSRLSVEAETGAGSASNEFGLPSEGQVSQSFRGRLGDGGAGSLELHTGGGSIRLGKS